MIIRITKGKVEEIKGGGWKLVKDSSLPEKKLSGSRSLKIEELEERKSPNIAWGE